MEVDGAALARWDGGDRSSGATIPDVFEELVVQRAADALPSVVGAYPDHVDAGLVGVVRADKSDQEADDPITFVLGDPGRAGEVPERRTRQTMMGRSIAPPLVDLLGRSAAWSASFGRRKRRPSVTRRADGAAAAPDARPVLGHEARTAATTAGRRDLERHQWPEDLAEIVEQRQDATLGQP